MGARFSSDPSPYPSAIPVSVGEIGEQTSRTEVPFVLKMQIISRCGIKGYIRYLMRLKALGILSSVEIAFDYLQSSGPVIHWFLTKA